jgi:hypothetical protein
MLVPWRRAADHLHEIGNVVLGLLLSAIPLALWIAWSEIVFFAVLATCFIAMGLLIALTRSSNSAETDRQAENRADRRDGISPEFIAELHRLVPFTYHHRLLGDTRIRKKMARLRALMRMPED